jgi:hypothetical protein
MARSLKPSPSKSPLARALPNLSFGAVGVSRWSRAALRPPLDP